MNVLDVRKVGPSDLVREITRYPRSVVVTKFSPPLDMGGFFKQVTAWSSPGVDLESAAIRLIRNEPAVTDSTALSLAELALHTDGSFLECPPPRFILSCSMPDELGAGASTLLSVERILAEAPEWVMEALSLATFRFLKTYDGDLRDSYVGSVFGRLETDPHAVTIRWRADHLYQPKVVDSRGTRATEAVAWLYEFCATYEPDTYLLQAGEVMIVPNLFFAHGRHALSPNSRRELFRAWLY